MNESTKTKRVRPNDFTTIFLTGRVIDIGAGDDLVCPWAEGFDIADGDANHVTRYRQELAYDAVHSSHCLEHMHDPASALHDWWRLLKPGGWLILVIPEESLYEQRHWPSLFNGGHKWTFRLGGESTWSPRSIEINSLVATLPNCAIESIRVQRQGYDDRLKDDGTRKALPAMASRLLIRLDRFGAVGHWLRTGLFQVLFRLGYAVDQTLGNALAQIEVIARKRKLLP